MFWTQVCEQLDRCSYVVTSLLGTELPASQSFFCLLTYLHITHLYLRRLKGLGLRLKMMS